MENKTMTPQQALTEIRHFCRGNVEALKIAEEAIEANKISKKPINVGCKTACPNCIDNHSCRIVMHWEKYCPDCGQAIDWSEEE